MIFVASKKLLQTRSVENEKIWLGISSLQCEQCTPKTRSCHGNYHSFVIQIFVLVLSKTLLYLLSYNCKFLLVEFHSWRDSNDFSKGLLNSCLFKYSKVPWTYSGLKGFWSFRIQLSPPLFHFTALINQTALRKRECYQTNWGGFEKPSLVILIPT
jgi:hypothetical protein